MEILRRATEVFERRGVNRTSIEDIAKAVGIKREAVYYYFKSRAEILLKIILPQSNSLAMNLENVLRSNQPALDKLKAAIRAHLDSFNPNYLEMTVALREDHFFEGDDKLKELRRVWRDYGELWIRLIREGQQAGEFDAALDPKVVAYGVLGMCNWLSRWFDPTKDVTIEQIIDTYFAMAVRGIAVGPSAVPAAVATVVATAGREPEPVG